MNKEAAFQLAIGYAWGQQDAHRAFAKLVHAEMKGTETVTTDDRDGSYLFAAAYACVQEDYTRERRGMVMPVGDAYARWQATGGRTIEAEHDVEADLLAEARTWIRDTFAGQPDSGTVDPDVMTDDAVRRGMDVHYAGGWKAFRRTALSVRYVTRSQP